MAMIKRGKMWYTDDWDSGHRIRRALDKNERIAKSLYQDFRESLRARRLGLIPKNTSLNNFKNKYLEFVKNEKSLHTHRKTSLAFSRLEEFSSINRIAEITPELMEDLKIKWKTAGYKPSAITTYIVYLKTAMKTAESWKYIAPQPWHGVRTYKSPPRLHYFTVEELKKVLTLCKEPFYTAALLMARTGLRSGEVRHLRYEDIDFDNRTLWIHGKPCDVCRECKHRRNYWQVKGSKPNKPKERYVDMPKDLEHHLKSFLVGTGLVLGPEMLSTGTYWYYFSDLSSRASFNVSAHKFRHTYGAHLASSGKVNLIQIGELMGHSDPKSTQIYAHLLPHARRQAVDELPDLGS